MRTQVDGSTTFWPTKAGTQSTTIQRPSALHGQRGTLVRWVACFVQFVAVLGLACSLQAGPQLSLAKSPVFVDVTVNDVRNFLTRSADEHTKHAQSIAAQLNESGSADSDRVIALRLRTLPFSFDQLRAADQTVVRTLAGKNKDAGAWYESRVAAFMQSVLSATDDDVNVSVVGLPVEARSAGASAAVATNTRYSEVIDAMDTFVATRRMILSGSNVNELQTLNRTLPEAFRLAEGRSILFRTNNNWRMVTTTGAVTTSAAGTTIQPVAPDTNSSSGTTTAPPIPSGMESLLASVNNAGPLAELIGDWGTTDSPWDLVDSQTFQPPGDNMVNGADLAYMLGNWSTYYPDQENPPADGGDPTPPDDGGDTGTPNDPPPSDGGNTTPPPPPSGQVAAFMTLGSTYTLDSGISLPLSVATSATNVDNVVFQVWSNVTFSIEAVYADYTPPFVYPASALNNATAGSGEVQAVVRDSNDGLIVVVNKPVTFQGGGSTPPDSGGDPTPPDDGGDPTPPDDGGNNNPPPPPNDDPQDPADPTTPSITGSPMGVNLSDLQYYSAEWPFKDFFRTSMPWRDGSWNMSIPVNLTPDGYPLLNPGQSAVTLLCRDIGGAYPTGPWVLLYDGSGTVNVGGNAQLTGSAPGRLTFQVTNPTNEGIHVVVSATNNANPVRNIRVMPAEFESNYQTQPFHPLFLDRLQHFSVLRFMDWMKTNNSTQQNWSDRPKVNYASWGTKGAPVEIMVALSNETGASPWFCMPHLATDDYVRKFAEYVRDNLDPDIKAYVELSNECWNSMFQQTSYFQAQGQSQGLASDPYLATLYGYSKRAGQVMDIWTSVFAGQTDRIVRVLAGHAENPWANEQIMGFQNAFQKADALAVAPYFGGWLGNSSNTVNMTVDQILDAAQANIAVQKGHSQTNRNNAAARGLELIAYEGGQHLVGVGGNVSNQTLTNKFIEANRHPRMGELYLMDMQNWQSVGGGVFVTYSFCGKYSQWGSWGLIEKQNQSLATAPKFQAIIQYVQQYLQQNQGGN